jgi:hypothetical protein
MKLNLLKCIFAILGGEFLGFLIRIELNSKNITKIMDKVLLGWSKKFKD